MRIGRTLPPAAALLHWKNLCGGVIALASSERRTRALEKEIREFFCVEDVFLVSSGTSALIVTLKALKALSPRPEIVLPAYTCPSVAAAAIAAGLQPVLCDVEPATFDYDARLLERTINEKTLCVVVHHLFGVPSNVARIRRLCRQHGAFVVEDAAQAMGVSAGGRWLGTLGDAGIFSFGRGKNITCGSGGAIVTTSARIAGAIAREYRHLSAQTVSEELETLLELALMAVFVRPSLYWVPAGLRFLKLGETVYPTEVRPRRIGAAAAGVLRNWTRRLNRANRIRSTNAACFVQSLALRPPAGSRHPYLRLPLVMPHAAAKRDLCRQSRRWGLGVSAAYPMAVNEIPEIRHLFAGATFPGARRLAQTLVTLPTHHWLTRADRQAIARHLSAVFSLPGGTVSGRTKFPVAEADVA
jgi:perosamine synthetase